jgi:hypothetical protein
MTRFVPLFVVALALTIAACGNKKNDERQKRVADSLHRVDSLRKADSIRIASLPKVEQDTLLDNVARFIAGLPQLRENSFTKLQKDKYWMEYQASMDGNWKKMVDTRLSKMADWEKETLSKSINDSLTLLYPFSGPDFLHAYYLFPRTREYIMMALEPVRPIASLDSIPEKERDQFLDSLGNSLRDIFNKSYFITNHMIKDLKKVKGVLPPMYFFFERSGYEMVSQDFITLNANGEEEKIEGKKVHWNKVQGVKFVVRHRERGDMKTVYYFSANIQDKGLKERPQLVKFVMKRAPYNTFVKSASYLMHHATEFSQIREMILKNSEALFQDDTGIPYKYFKDKPEWKAQFYGEYVAPVEDFGRYLYQADLDAAYKGASQPLPFSLGYHWSTRKQNYMLFTNSARLSTAK